MPLSFQVEDFGAGIRNRLGERLAGLDELGAGLPEGDHLGAALPAPLARQLLALGFLASAALGVAAHVDAGIDPGPLQGAVAGGFPTGAQLFQLGGALGLGQGLARARAVAFACPALLRGLGVVPLEVLLGVALDAVALALREHQMDVRLLAAVGCRGCVDRPLVGVPLADLLLDPLAHDRHPLRGVEFAREGDFHFAVGGAVLALEGVRCLPEDEGVVLRPGGQVACLGCFQPLGARKAGGIRADASDVGGMRPGLADRADLHAQAPDGHCRCSSLVCAVGAGVQGTFLCRAFLGLPRNN